MLTTSTTYVNSHSLKERVATAEQFLEELGKGLPDHERVMVGYADEATPQKNDDGKFKHNNWWPEPWRLSKGLRSNNNCYVCISSAIKTMNEKTGAMRYWRSDANFGHGLALMVDDIGTGKGSKGSLTVEALSAILPPTAVVATSPGNHQLWYFLAAPEPNKLLFKGFLTSFVDAVLRKGGDHTIKDITRFGRMPVGYNNKRVNGALKYADTSSKPFQVQLVTADYSRRYTVFEIAAAFAFTIAVQKVKEETAVERAERIAEAPLNELLLRAAVEASVALGLGDGHKNGSGKYRILCPWRDQHGTGAGGDDAYFRGHVTGAEYEYVFGCGHDSCRKGANKRTWSTFVDAVVMPYIEYQLDCINKQYS